MKTTKNTNKDNNLKQLKTANSNSPRAYIWEGLLSEGYLRLRFWGLIFGRVYLFNFFFEGRLLSEFYGSLPFTVSVVIQIHTGKIPYYKESSQAKCWWWGELSSAGVVGRGGQVLAVWVGVKCWRCGWGSSAGGVDGGGQVLVVWRSSVGGMGRGLSACGVGRGSSAGGVRGGSIAGGVDGGGVKCWWSGWGVQCWWCWGGQVLVVWVGGQVLLTK